MHRATLGVVGAKSRFLLLALSGLMLAAPAYADKRVALVIGVNDYPHLAPHLQLKKAINDAEALDSALRKLGFDVTLARNPGLEEMIGKVNALASRVEPGDTVFFFFSGHGLSPDGTNLLLPSDMPNLTDGGPAGRALARRRGYSELEIINSFRNGLIDKKTGVQRGVVIFASDACRNNPFAGGDADPTKSFGGRSISVEPKGTVGVFSIYAAGMGQEALDRLSDDDPSPNSVFLRVFLNELIKPGVQLGDVIVDARERVAELAATHIDVDTGQPHRQTPAYYDETTGGRIFLAGRGSGVVPAAEPSPGPTTNVESKSSDRVPQERSAARTPDAGAPGAGPPSAAAQRAVLYEESANDPKGKLHAGTVVWRTELVSPGSGQPVELAVRADLEIPEVGLSATWSLRHNTDPALPASHTIEIMFHVPANFPGGGIANVPGVLVKPTEQARGTPLAGITVKVTSDFFLLGLSVVEADVRRNVDLLKERSWFDIPIVYANGSRAILTMEKGPPGERALAAAFAAWKS
jgi:hypothetical protein